MGKLFAKLKFFPCRLQPFDLSENGYLVPFESKTDWERCFQTKKKIVHFLNFPKIFENFLKNREKLFATPKNI